MRGRAMELNTHSDENFGLVVTAAELRILLTCLGHSFVNVPPREYTILIGAEPEQVGGLARELRAVMEAAGIDLHDVRSRRSASAVGHKDAA
jgi:hypothetical protein